MKIFRKTEKFRLKNSVRIISNYLGNPGNQVRISRIYAIVMTFLLNN